MESNYTIIPGDIQNMSPLHRASWLGRVDEVRYLLNSCDVNEKDLYQRH